MQYEILFIAQNLPGVEGVETSEFLSSVDVETADHQNLLPKLCLPWDHTGQTYIDRTLHVNILLRQSSKDKRKRKYHMVYCQNTYTKSSCTPECSEY